MDGIDPIEQNFHKFSIDITRLTYDVTMYDINRAYSKHVIHVTKLSLCPNVKKTMVNGIDHNKYCSSNCFCFFLSFY